MSVEFNTVDEQASYGIGRQVGEQLKSQPFDGMQAAAVIAGITDVLEGNASQVEEATIREAIETINQRIQAQRQEEAGEQAAASEAFLASNAERDDVTVTQSGLQYEILESGEGDSPAATDQVRVHYHGTLVNGNVFDSSVERNQPTEFPVNGVIPGWTEALQMMRPGDKWKLYIPHELAYGANGAGGVIGPYEALIFEVELLDIL